MRKSYTFDKLSILVKRERAGINLGTTYVEKDDMPTGVCIIQLV